MKKILVLFILFVMFSIPAFAKHLYQEKEYQQVWCKANKGELEYVLPDGARVDCLNSQYAVEFDFANKWAESIGQALYYAKMTGKKPAVVLIMENPSQEQRYLNRLNQVAQSHNISVFTMKTKDMD